jgi:hypothetical protein
LTEEINSAESELPRKRRRGKRLKPSWFFAAHKKCPKGYMSPAESQIDFRPVDLSVVIVANIINLLVIAVFLVRTLGKRDLEHMLGVVLVLCAIPLLYALYRNVAAGREWWAIVLPGFMVFYLILELLLDYILKVEFRQTALLWPYLLVFYLSLTGMIGYAFLSGKIRGYITLGTYFLGLFAAWYSYSKVGHG